MGSIVDPVIDMVDAILSWLTSSLKATTEAYCDLETAISSTEIVARDGSLISVIRLYGASELIGDPEFDRIHLGITTSLQTAFSRPGHAMQVLFDYDTDGIKRKIEDVFQLARQTAKKLQLDLDDLFDERLKVMTKYCAKEEVYLVLWTRPSALSSEQYKRMAKQKQKIAKENKLPPFVGTQNLNAHIPDIRQTHDAFVQSTLNDLRDLNLYCDLYEVHDALRAMRVTVDPDFTDLAWRPYLPGDRIPERLIGKDEPDIAELLWPPLAGQVMPRDAENIDLRTCRIGDRIYSAVFIDLFPKDIKPFIKLFQRTLAAKIPWRISFMMESEGLRALGMKKTMSAILSFAANENRLINDATALLNELSLSSDEAIVKLRVAASTWAPMDNSNELRMRTSQLVKAIQGWGSCEVSEISGDPFGGVVSSMLGVSATNLGTASVAPLSEVTYMLPISRPASAWVQGAVLFRTPDGKPWPFQPGSAQQTTWIDLFYARPGSGKSVLSNALNLGLVLMGGIQRIPRIAIIDIGPSSSGLISLLKEALPLDKRHLVTYQRMRMVPEYSINPFDTQLGCRFPTAQERTFLVNFITLLATPVGDSKPYDGVADMAGMIVDELYKSVADTAKPSIYTAGLEMIVDGILEEIGFVPDSHTSWWEVTDALFVAGFSHEAMIAQRYAMPLLSDVVSISRLPVIEDLYGQIVAPTGEPLIKAFSRMISAAVREYPILSRVTQFDLGESRIVSLDLDEVAKTGGDAADRQTAVMYMLARYILAKDFYLTEDNVTGMPVQYREFHKERIGQIREDPKRIVMDEFHRTSKAKAVRDQVIVDMREGRKWNVQVALLSQSVDDFDSVMIEFATSVYILDAGPEQALKRTAEVFGLSETAQLALKTRVHGPREGGATFLAQFSTKRGMNTQLLTSTLGPVELWSFSTTAEDANLRNKLYMRLGPAEARRVLATLFPTGTVKPLVEERMASIRETEGHISDEENIGIVDGLLQEILDAYSKNPQLKSLPV